MPKRERGFLRLSGADHRLEYTWTTARHNHAILDRRGLPTREVTLHPDETALPFPNGSGGDHDKLEAHFFEPLYAIQSAWDRQSIVNPIRAVIFLDLALEGRTNQCRIDVILARQYRSLLGCPPTGVL